MADGEHAHEIFIIKRHGGHEDAHHGGVWKIAFADFMTAMMAFFLVMWLISANDKTKATIASYFNPVKLVDTTTQPKGLEDAKAVESTAPSTKGAKPTNAKEEPSKEHPKAETKDGAKAGGEEASAMKAKEKRLATAVLEDPYAALTEIAGSRGIGDNASAPPAPSTNAKVSVNAISHKGGEAFRDPFSPMPLPKSATPDDIGDVDLHLTPRGAHPETAPPVASAKGEADVKPESANALPVKAPSPAAAPQVADVKAQIAAALKSGAGEKSGPQVEVHKGDGGILISLTDTADYEMFSSASAVPTRKVVLLVERIAEVLKSKPGKIVIRGYTDARPYKAGRYDNWHLSLDRAQVMHYMLVRGGLDENRIAHIEGYADRNLRNAANPTSPVNRRIEILVKEDAP